MKHKAINHSSGNRPQKIRTERRPVTLNEAKAYAKLTLSNYLSEGYLRQIMHLFEQKEKGIVSNAVDATKRANRIIESKFPSYSIAYAEDDAELLDLMIEASVAAEARGKQSRFKNDVIQLIVKYK